MPLTDQELLEGVREGNLPSLEGLVRRYARPLLGFYYFLTWDRHKAEDAVQEVFRILWNRRGSRRPVGVVKLSLFHSALKLREILFSGEESGYDDLELDWTHPFWTGYLQPEWDQDIQGGWGEKIRKALKELDDEDRIILILVRYSGLSLQEVSEILQERTAKLRGIMHGALDRLAGLLLKSQAAPLTPCREAPPGFPLPAESPSPGDHVNDCPVCSRRLSKHKDVWEILADLDLPPIREGLWPELKRALASAMKVRTVYPTGRLPRPIPEEARIGRRTSRFWLRFTTVASVVIALISMYVLLVPAKESTVPSPGGREGRGATMTPGPSKDAPERFASPAPPPFLLIGGAPDAAGATCTVRAFGSESVAVSVHRVENPGLFLRGLKDVTRVRIEPGLVQDALISATSEGGSLLRLVDEQEAFLAPSRGDTPGLRSIRMNVPGPGLYLVEARRGDFVAHVVKVVGTLRVLVKRSRTSAVAWVADAGGTAVRGTSLAAFLEGREIPVAKVLESGAIFEGVPDFGRLVLFARKGEDVALVPCDPPPKPGAGSPWILLDVPACAPGDAFKYLGFLPTTDRDSMLEVRSPDKVLMENNAFLFPSGRFSGSIGLSRDRERTELEVSVSVAGKVQARAFLGVRRLAELKDFSAIPGKRAMVSGEQTTFAISGKGRDAGSVAFLPFAYRFLLISRGTAPRVLSEGSGVLDIEGRGNLQSPSPLNPGRLLLELGSTPGALTPVAETRIAGARWCATLQGVGGFAEVGDPFKAVFTLKDFRGAPVKGAEVRSFVVGAPFSINTGEHGRTDEGGRLEMEILFRKRGIAEITADASGKEGFEARAGLQIPVSDGTPLENARPVFRSRRARGKTRLLVRGFGPSALVTAVDAGGSLERFPLQGEILEPTRGEDRWFFIDGIVDGKHVQAGLNPLARDPSSRLRIHLPPEPWMTGESRLVEVLSPPRGTLPEETEVVLLSTIVQGSGPPFSKPPPIPPSSSSAASVEFQSFGHPVVGPTRFHERPRGAHDGKEEEIRDLAERLERRGVPPVEIRRFLGLDAQTAQMEMTRRLERKTPLPRIPLPTGLSGPGIPGPAPEFAHPAGKVRWQLGRAESGKPGKFSVRCGESPGTVHLVALAAMGRRWLQASRSIEVNRASSLNLTAPPFLRPGDEAEIRAVLHNAEDAPWEGILRLNWEGTETSVEAEVTVGPGETVEKSFSFTAPDKTRRIEARFRTGRRSLFSRASVSLLHVPAERVWKANGVLGEKSFASFPSPAGPAPAFESIELILGRGPRDVLLQCLQDMDGLELPDSLSLAGKLLAFASSWRAFRKNGGKLPDAILSLQRAAGRARTRLKAFRSDHGGYRRWPGGPEDRMATAAAALALAEAEALLEPPGRDDSLDGLAEKVETLAGEKMGGENTRAHLYLALASLPGQREIGKAIREAFTEAHRRHLSPQALARLCLAARKAGCHEEAGKLASELKGCIVLRDDRVRFLRLEGPGRGESDPVIVAALALQALAANAPDDPLLPVLFRYLLRHRSGTSWGSPFRSGMVAAGLAALIEPPLPPGPFTAELNARLEASGTWSSGGGFVKFPGGSLWAGENFLAVESPGTKDLIWALKARAKLREPPRGSIPLLLSFSPMEKKGGVWGKGGVELRISWKTPVLGTVFLNPSESLEDVLVTVHLPAGLSPLAPGRIRIGKPPLPVPGTAQVRPGSVVFYLPRLDRGPSLLHFTAIMGWKGSYTIPPARVTSLVRDLRGFTRRARLDLTQSAENGKGR